ncbi:NAD-dependent epimerase/dehydratase family protein [Frateuria aurantia]
MGVAVAGRPILVIGGRSQVGYFLRRQLAGAGLQALALSREPGLDEAGWRWLPGALPGSVPPLPPLAAILSAGPLAPLCDWLAAMPQLDCPCVVATSSMSAESKQDSPVPAERELAARLREGEIRLAELCRRQGRHWTILRPTLIYGAGLDRSLSPIARAATRWRIFPLPPGGGLRQPVHADDVAAALLAGSRVGSASGPPIACGGGERLPAAEMFARVWRSLPRRVVPVPVPKLAVKMYGALDPARAGMLERLEQDLIADNTRLRDLLGLQPRPFQPRAECWWPAI